MELFLLGEASVSWLLTWSRCLPVGPEGAVCSSGFTPTDVFYLHKGVCSAVTVTGRLNSKKSWSQCENWAEPLPEVVTPELPLHAQRCAGCSGDSQVTLSCQSLGSFVEGYIVNSNIEAEHDVLWKLRERKVNNYE